MERTNLLNLVLSQLQQARFDVKDKVLHHALDVVITHRIGGDAELVRHAELALFSALMDKIVFEKD